MIYVDYFSHDWKRLPPFESYIGTDKNIFAVQTLERLFSQRIELSKSEKSKTSALESSQKKHQRKSTLENSSVIAGKVSSNGSTSSQLNKVTLSSIFLPIPILLKAPASCGKTLLLEGIAQKAHRLNSKLKIALGQAVGLVELFENSPRGKLGPAKRIRELQQADILLLDDVHHLAPYPYIQSELAILLDELIKKNKIVITTMADNSANYSNKLEQHLLSRLSSGIVLELFLPDLDVRMRVIESEANRLKLSLSKTVCLTLAKFTNDIRKLLGIIKTLDAFVKTSKAELNEDDLKRILKNYTDTVGLTPETIMFCTAQYYSLQVRDLLGKNRSAHVVLARQISMYLCRRLLGVSYSHIAQIFEKDHTTVLHACSKIENKQELQSTLSILSQKIEQTPIYNLNRTDLF